MATSKNNSGTISTRLFGHRLALTLSTVAVLYAAFAGLRTVADPDTGWQLATGRWIVQHRSIPAVDVLSHTAAGSPWVYPVLSQVLFYLLFVVGGFAALSWLSDVVCVGITAMLSRGNLVTRCLSILLVPLVANRTVPRAELFTELFFAACLAILWNYRQRGAGPLWLLPVVMLLWTNTHMGFIAGLALFAAYVLFEAESCIAAETRGEALARLRRAIPWLLVAAAMTFVTPFGIQRNVQGVSRLVPVHSNSWVAELHSVPVNVTTLSKAVDLRDPRSAVWMFMLIAVLAIIAALLRRRFVAAAVLATALWAAIHSARFSTLFAMLVTVIGGEMLAGLSEISLVNRGWDALRQRVQSPQLPQMAKGTVCLLLFILVLVRVADLVSNRYYIRVPQQSSSFGAGEAFWYPENAASFIKQNHLPGNMFNDYNVGGFVAFRLGPEYPDYIDGRGAPFGDAIFFRALELESQRMDSELWKKEAETRHINTVLVSLDMEFGSVLSNLRQYCESSGWQLAFIDTEAAVFTRSNANNAPSISCDTVTFDRPPQFAGTRNRAEQFRYYRNASAILIALGRQIDAEQTLSRADQLFPDNMATHYLRGALLQNAGHFDDAERELARACELEPGEQTWHALAGVYKRQGRAADAMFATEKALQFSPRPQGLHLEMGFLQLNQRMPEQALASFDRAETAHGPNIGNLESSSFFRYLNRGRAKAWNDLALMYQAQGQMDQARSAKQQAEKFAGLNSEGGSAQ